MQVLNVCLSLSFRTVKSGLTTAQVLTSWQQPSEMVGAEELFYIFLWQSTWYLCKFISMFVWLCTSSWSSYK